MKTRLLSISLRGGSTRTDSEISIRSLIAAGTPRFSQTILSFARRVLLSENQMSEESEKTDPKAFERFRKLVKKVVGVPKSEVNRRAAEWKAARETERNEESEE